MINYVALKDELLNDPMSVGYAPYLADGSGRVAELINEQKFFKIKSRMISARAILAECADGATILDHLEAAGSVNSAVKWAVKFLGQDAGIDVGHHATQAMIDALTGPVLSASEATQLKNMAMQPASRAEVLGFSIVESSDIQKALE